MEEILREIYSALDDVLRTAEKSGYPLEKIDKVLLVGGSSRMPQVAKMIAEEYHVIPTLQDPDEAVAKGAAVYGTNEKAFKDFVLSEAQKAGKTVEQLTQESQDSGKTLEEKFATIFSLLERYRIKANLIHNSAVNLSLCVDNSWHIDEAVEALREAGFDVMKAEEMELLTVRGYTEELWHRYARGPQVFIRQATQSTVRVVRKRG